MRFETEGLYVEVAGVTNEADALFAIGLGASAVAFDFAPTPWQISPALAHDIVRRLPLGALSIGVFRGESPERVVEIANTLGLNGVRLEGHVALTTLRYVSERVATVMRSARNSDDARALCELSAVDYVAVPEADSNADLRDVGDVLGDDGFARPLLVAGGLDPTNVTGLVQRFPVWGVSVRSGAEQVTGSKDPALLGDFIANARWAEHHATVSRPWNAWRET